MKKRSFNVLMRISAFLFPFYFVFYVPPDEDREDSLSGSFWKYIVAGFCFYAVVVGLIIVI